MKTGTSSSTQRYIPSPNSHQSCRFLPAQPILSNPMKTTPMKIKHILAILAAAVTLLSAMNCSATTYTFNVASGVWNNAANWSPSTGYPGSADTAIIPTGDAVTGLGGSSQSCTTLTIQGTGSLTVDANTLTVSGATTIGTSGAATLTIASGATFTSTSTSGSSIVYGGTSSTIVNNGTFNCSGGNGSGGTTPTFQNNKTATFTGSSQSFNSTVAVTQGANAVLNLNSSSTTPFGGSSKLTASATGNTVSYGANGPNVYATPYYNLSFTGASGSYSYSTSATVAGTLTVGGATSVNNVSGTFGAITLSGGNVTLNASTTVSGNLLVSSGTFYAQVSSGSFTVSGTTTISGGTIELGNVGATFTGNFTLGSGTFNSSYSGQNGPVTFGGSLTVSGGTFTAGTGVNTFSGSSQVISGTISIPKVTVNGTYANTGTLTVSTALAGSGTLTQNANSTLNIGGTSTVSTLAASANTPNTVAYNGSGAQTVMATTYNNLTVSGGNTKTLAGAATVNGTLTIAASTTLADGGFTLTANGNVSNSGTHSGTGQISLTGGSGLHSLSGTGAYQNLTLNDANGASIASGTSTVNGTLTLTSGVLSGGGGALTLGNSAAISVAAGSLSSLTPTFGTSLNLTYNGTGATTTGAELPTSTTVLNNLTINDAAGVTLNASATLKGRLTLTSGALSIGANTLTLNGGITTTSGSLTGGSTSSLSVGGSTATTLPGSLTLSGLTLNDSSGLALGGNTTVGGTLTLTSGLLNTAGNQVNLASGASVSGGSSSSYVNGAVQKTFATGTQSFTFPIGVGSIYAPLALSSLSVTAGGALTATTTSGNYSPLGPSGINSTADVSQYWTLTQSGGTFGTYGATFNYPSSEANGTAASYVVRQYNGSVWSPTTISGTPTTTAASITGQSGFGIFAIGDQLSAQLAFTTQPGGGAAGSAWTAQPVVTVEDANGDKVTTDTSSVTLAIGSNPGGGTLSGTKTVAAVAGVATFSGLSINATGNGYTLTATDGSLTNATSSTFNIVCPTLTMTPAAGALTGGIVGTPYSQTFVASNGIGSYTYAVTGGTQPTGLALSSGGVLSGTPTAAATYNFTVTATDSNNCTVGQAYSVTMGCPTITVAPASLPNFVLNAAIGNLSNSASGGISPYTYSLSGSVPAGLSINSNTGALTGTPTNAGAYAFTVTATDSNSCTGSTAYSVAVGAPPSFTLQPTNTLVYSGSSAMFTATAAGDGTLSYAWRLVNTGWGFPWSVTGSNFLGSSTGNDQGNPACPSFGNNDIDSSTGNAWGLYGPATAVRGFPALTAGQVFGVDMDNGNVDSGAKNGFRLQQASGPNDLFKFYFLGGQGNYKYWDSAGEHDTGIGFTLTGLNVEVLLGASSTYTLVVTPCGGTPVQFFGTLPAGTINQVLLECNNAGGNCGGCDNLYFNNLLAGNNDDNAGFYNGALGTAGNTDQGSQLAVSGSGATTASYTTPALNYPGDNGNTYQLLVYSPYGAAFSGLATATVNPPPPVAGTAYYTRPANISLKIAISDLLTNVTVAEDDYVTLVGVGTDGLNLLSTNGTTLFTNSTYILYTNSVTPNVNDSFNYTVSDVVGQRSIGTVLITINNNNIIGQTNVNLNVSSTNVTANFFGVPGYQYTVDRSTNLTQGLGWVPISTNTAPANGLIQVVDDFQDLGIPIPPVPSSVFYRLRYNP